MMRLTMSPVVNSDNREAELLANALATSGQIGRATSSFRQTRDTTSTQSMDLAKIAQLKTSIKNLEDNAAFYEASEEDWKDELAKATAEHTRLGELFDSMRTQVVDFREKLATKDAVIQPIV